MTKKKPPTDIGKLLDEAARVLLDRVLHPTDEDKMTVAQFTAAFKSVVSYYSLIKTPGNGEGDGGFNGWREQAQNLGARRGNGRNPADFDGPSEEPDF